MRSRNDVDTTRVCQPDRGAGALAECDTRPYVEQRDEGNHMTTQPAARPTPATAEGAAPRVARNDGESRYEIWVGEVLGGFTEFEPDTHGRLVFPHTEIDPAFKGQGLGGILVEQALADVASRGETIVPRCPFVVRYLRRHDVEGLIIDWPNEPGFVR
jgi:predicted GNAT family acetyltransferase